MRSLTSRLLTLLLSLTLVAGIGIAAFILYPTLAPNPPSAPSVEFRSVEIGSVVTVAVAVRGEQVTRAELWSDNQLLAREMNPNPALSNPWTVAWQWTPPHPGVFPLAVRAFDDAGRYGGSSLFDVVVPPRQRLLFSSNRNDKYALYVLAIDTRETALFDAASSQNRQANVSSVQVAAFASNRSGSWHIYSRALDATPVTDLTPNVVAAQRPVWSADGQRLAYELTISNTTNIFVADARGLALANPIQVTHGDGYDGQVSFSPSGARIAFAAQQGGQWDIYAMDLDGSNLVRLTSDAAQDSQPAWSPDGSRIAFVSNRSGIAQIYQMSAAGENVARLTNFPGGAEQPAWSPDGNWLAFVAYTGDAQGDNRRELYLLYAPKDEAPVENRGLVHLTQNGFDDTEPTWIGR